MSSLLRHAALTGFATLAVVTAAEAQTCLGNASFTRNHLQLAGEVAGAPDVAEFGASFVSGSASVFAGLGVGGAAYDGSDAGLVGRGVLGYQVPASSGGRVQACPILRAALGFGPQDFDGFGGDLRTQSFGFGLALGAEMVRSGSVSLVPSLTLGFQYDRAEVVGGLMDDAESETYGLAGVALGIVLNDALAIRPSIAFPLQARRDDPIVGVGLVLNYGGRR